MSREVGCDEGRDWGGGGKVRGAEGEVQRPVLSYFL